MTVSLFWWAVPCEYIWFSSLSVGVRTRFIQLPLVYFILSRQSSTKVMLWKIVKMSLVMMITLDFSPDSWGIVFACEIRGQSEIRIRKLCTCLENPNICGWNIMNKTQMQGYRLNYERKIVFPKSSILLLGPKRNWAFISSMPKLRFICQGLGCPLEVFVPSIWWKELNLSFGQQTRKFELTYTPFSRSRNTSLASFELCVVFLCTYINILARFDHFFIIVGWFNIHVYSFLH